VEENSEDREECSSTGRNSRLTFNLACPCLLVEPLGVSSFGFLQGRVDKNLQGRE
jgi:hypothetical protein